MPPPSVLVHGMPVPPVDSGFEVEVAAESVAETEAEVWHGGTAAAQAGAAVVAVVAVVVVAVVVKHAVSGHCGCGYC